MLENLFTIQKKNFKISIADSEQEAGKIAFELVKESKNQGASVFGLATGSTPIKLYQEISNSDLDFSDCISINLDEYVGLTADDNQSYAHFMNDNLFQYKPFKESHLLNGLADEEEELENYERLIENNPIDFQLLGVGENGHIAFNEPGTGFDSKTHKVQLTQSTINANKRFFNPGEQVPEYAYTMGIETILKADRILMMALGDRKAEAVHDMIEEPMTEEVPASALQDHKEVYVILDKASAAKLDI